MVFALFLFLSLFSLILIFSFTFLLFILVLIHLTLHFVFVLLLFSPQKHEVNPKPRTLRWTTLRGTAQNFALFFPSSRHNFHSSFSLLGSFRWILLVFLKAGTLNIARLEFSGCRVNPRRPHQTGPPGLAHDSPRTPNAHIWASRRFKHYKNSTKGPQERERRKKNVAREEGKKARNFGPPHPSGLGLHPSGLHPSGLHPSGQLPFRALPFGASTLQGPTLCGPKIQHLNIGRSRNWPKSKLAEVDIGRSRTGRTRKKRAGRSRNWLKSITPLRPGAT